MKSISYRYGRAGGFFLVLIIAAVSFYIIDFQITDIGREKEFIKDIYFESHGLLFDLFVFGVVLSLYDAFKSSRDKIKENTDKLDIHKQHDTHISSVESTYLIKEMNRLGKKKFNLNGSHFHRNWKIESISLKNSECNSANLSGVTLLNCSLIKSHFNCSSFEAGIFEKCTINKSDFRYSNLDQTRIVDEILSKGDEGFEKWLKKAMTKDSYNWFKENYTTQPAHKVSGIPAIRIIAAKPLKVITKGAFLSESASSISGQIEKGNQSIFEDGVN